MVVERPRVTSHGYCFACGPSVAFTCEGEQREHLAEVHGGHGRIEIVVDAYGLGRKNARTSRVESGTERPVSPYLSRDDDEGTRAADPAPAGAGPLLPPERPSDDARAQYAVPDELVRSARDAHPAGKRSRVAAVAEPPFESVAAAIANARRYDERPKSRVKDGA